MNTANLTTYLKDHLAGSVAALELIDHLILSFSNSSEAAEMEKLKAEVAEDQKTLKDLLGRLEVEEGSIKKAGAWAAEKMLQIKVKTGDDALGTLEALEVLVLGIEGKLRLWHSLECVDMGLNLPQLQATAARQIEQVETLRLQAAQRAFA